nr:LysR family transcriptional regulator [Pseudomonas putida]
MRIFIRVSEVGSFTGVAKILNISPPHVSRCVADLEEHVRARLIQRNTRHQSLTEAGVKYLKNCREIIAKVDEAAQEANRSSVTPQGCLRVHSDIEFGIEHLPGLVATYTSHYPDVHIELTLAPDATNLIDEQQDMQIVLCERDSLSSSEMIAQYLGGYSSVVCASPGYLGRHGVPLGLDDLRNHVALGLNGERYQGALLTAIGEQLPPLSGGVKANMIQTVRECAIAGMGLCILPDYIAASSLQSGRLQRILPQIQLRPQSAYALYSSRKFLDAKIKTWVEFLREAVPKQLTESSKIAQNTEYFAHAAS